MSGLAQPFFICLILSLLWAPFVLICTMQIQRKQPSSIGGKLWPTALAIAALPAMFAPISASIGFSLRQQPAAEQIVYAAPAIANITTIGASETATRTFDTALVLDAAIALYVYGFILFFILGAVRFLSFSYRTRFAFDIDNNQLIEELNAWSGRMGLRKAPPFKYCDAVTSVCVYGFFKPKLLVPAEILDRLSVNDVVLMGAHELAHVKRHDTWLFAFTAMTRAVFWFNPFMRNIAARSILAAEQAADRLVLLRGAEQRDYARCFVNGLRNSAGLSRTDYELAPSFTPFDKKSRRERLNAILSANAHSPFGSKKTKALAIAGGVAAIGLAVAQAAFVVTPTQIHDELPRSPVDGPIEGKVTLGFKDTSVLLSADRPAHEGVDIKAKRGASVRAAGDGKVVAATSRYNNQPAWGKVVVIDHGHGLISRYAHLDNFIVSRGDVVLAGDMIGAVGSTGKTTGPHLHFEVLRNGQPVDPSPIIAAKPLPKPEILLEPAAAPRIEHALRIEPPIMVASAAAHDPIAIYDVTPAPAPVMLDGEGLEIGMAGELSELTDRMTELLKNDERFVDFEDFDFDFEGMNFEDFDGAETFTQNLSAELAEKFEGMSGVFDSYKDENGEIQLSGDLTIEELNRLREEQRSAMEKIHEDMERARHKTQKAREKEREKAEREKERAHAKSERSRERAERMAERDREHAEREHENAVREREYAFERAERLAEREHQRHQREWNENQSKQHDAFDEEKLLDIREKALKEAKADLDQELKEIEQQRKRLSRKNKSQHKN